MDLIIGLIVAVKSLVFMGGFISPDKLPAKISSMQVIVTQQEIKVGCIVANAFPLKLKNLALSGTPILLYVFTQVKQSDNDSLVANAVAENSIVYDLANKKYFLKKSIAADTLCFSNIDSALSSASAFSMMPVLTKEKVAAGKSYYFTMWAVLGKTRVEALGNKDIDLMYFWDYKRPSLRTEPFTGAQFLAAPGKK